MTLFSLPFLSPHRYELYLHSWKEKKQGFMSSLKFWFNKLTVFIFSPYFDLCLHCLLLNKGYCLFHVLFLFPAAHKVCIYLRIKCNYITKKIPSLPSSSSSSPMFIHWPWWCHMVWDPPLIRWDLLSWLCSLPAPYAAPACSLVGWGKRQKRPLHCARTAQQ